MTQEEKEKLERKEKEVRDAKTLADTIKSLNNLIVSISESNEAKGGFRKMVLEELDEVVKDSKKIVSDIQDVKIEMAKYISRQEGHTSTLKTHSDKIDILDAHRNKSLGIVAIIGVFVGSIATWIIHLLSSK